MHPPYPGSGVFAVAPLRVLLAVLLPLPVGASPVQTGQTVFAETFDSPGATTPSGPAELVAAGWEFRLQGAAGGAHWRGGDGLDGHPPFSWPGHLTIDGLPAAGAPAAAWAILPPDLGHQTGQQLFFGYMPWVDTWLPLPQDRWELYWSPSGGVSTGSAWDDLGDFTQPIELNHDDPGYGHWKTASGVLPGPGGRLALRYVYELWEGGTPPLSSVDDVVVVDAPAVALPGPGETVHWTVADSPIPVLEAKRIPTTATLVIDAGVELEFGSLAGQLVVEGELHVAGTEDAPVLLRLAEGAEPGVARVDLGYTDFAATDALAPARARLEHVDAAVRISAERGASLSVSASHFHQPAGVVHRYAGIRANGATVALRDTTFTHGEVVLRESYPLFDGVTLDDSVLALERHWAGSPLLIDGVTARDYVPGETFYGAGPISLYGSNHLLGPDNALTGNPVPVTLRGGGLLPGSVVPASGNVENVVEFIDNTARGVIDLATLAVPYLWRYDPGFHDLQGIARVQPGTTILFEPQAEIRITGHSRFVALGTPDAPIRLAPQQPGQRWEGLYYISNDRRPKLEHCIVAGAGYGVTATNSFVRLESCLVAENEVGAAAIQFGVLETGKTRFFDNEVGVRITGFSAGRLDGDPNPNWFGGNTIAVLGPDSTGPEDATGNYWGSASGPQHGTNPSGEGDPVDGPFAVVPFLTAAPDMEDHPPVVRLQPIRGEQTPGNRLVLHWSAEDDGSIAAQRIEYSPHGNNPGLSLFAGGIPAEARSFQVTIPDDVPSPNINPAAFRVVAVDDAGQEGWSDALFFHGEYGQAPFAFETDLAQGITVGQQIALEWGGVWGNVWLLLEDLGTFVDLGYGPDQGIVGNRVPAASTDLARYALFADGEDRWYFSDYFELRPEALLGDAPPEVELLSPPTGASYPAGTAVPVAWTAADDEGLRSFALQASYDGGLTWQPIADDLPGDDRSFAWQLPGGAGLSDVRLRVIARDHRLQASSDGTHSAFAITACGSDLVVSSETARVGNPPNPEALLPGVTSGPVLGQTWDPVVDHSTFLPGATADLLLVATAPANVPLGAPGTLLCDPAALAAAVAAPAAGMPFEVTVPRACGLLGATLHAQAASADASGSAHLTNALDVVVGHL